MLVAPDIERKPSVEFRLNIQPKAIQSVRFASRGGYVQTFQPKANKEWKFLVKSETYKQLPPGWKPLEGPLWVEIVYVFPPLKSFRKSDREWIEHGGLIFKETKPDVNDNLNKGLFDAFTGVLWGDDAQVAWSASQKAFGKVPGISVAVGTLPRTVKGVNR